MSVITIGGLSGGGGRKIGPILARKLNFDYVDRLILTNASKAMNASINAVTQIEERPKTFGERFSSKLQKILDTAAMTSSGIDPYFGPYITSYLTEEFENVNYKHFSENPHEIDEHLLFESINSIGYHIAIDQNEIQAKSGSTTASALHLNTLGGAVKFGGQEGVHEITVSGEKISSVEIIEGSDANGLALYDDEYENTYLKLTDDGIEMKSQGGFTIITNDPKPVTVGSSTHDGPGMIIRNTCVHANDICSEE